MYAIELVIEAKTLEWHICCTLIAIYSICSAASSIAPLAIDVDVSFVLSTCSHEIDSVSQWNNKFGNKLYSLNSIQDTS